MNLKRLVSLPLTTLALVVIANAAIDPGAPSASHHMEETAASVHDYVHDAGYPSSFGSHGLETDAAALHSLLHDWSNGSVTEAQVAVQWTVFKGTYKTYKQTINQAKVLNQGDTTLDALHEDVKRAYQDLRFTLRKIKS